MSTLCFLRVILVFLCCYFLTVFTCLKCGLRFFERSCLMCRASHLVCLKDPEKPLSSFLSSSSTSASWPEQISPLEPFKDSSAREASSFDALGVRPKKSPQQVQVQKLGTIVDGQLQFIIITTITFITHSHKGLYQVLNK